MKDTGEYTPKDTTNEEKALVFIHGHCRQTGAQADAASFRRCLGALIPLLSS